NHGVLSTGKSFQDCFGLIETVNKAAHIALMTHGQRAHQLDCEKVKRVCKQMGVQPREGLLD
ncbi:MAG: rhamnulose-1-phosphate aldolase, partial [Lactobacillus crispatus]|nr:rhamnulose-1-phosphate aldolase [Lactobacillus crispatus]